ncbi:MAG: peptidylprolyl isomerase [Polyangiaceae bacterium]|nr:peptidylprolyl isomerase [Polyangiaceae bacterium]
MTGRSPFFLLGLTTLLFGYIAYKGKVDGERAEAEAEKAAQTAQMQASSPGETNAPPASEGETPTPTEEAPETTPKDELSGFLDPMRFYAQPDGKPIPPLGKQAPKRIQLGIALFAYSGAQGVGPNFRTQGEALELAEGALKSAEINFDHAVGLGDPGSNKNIGWVRQGVLEPQVERAVFALKKGQILEKPIDSPRGFWVVKRIR